MVSLEFSDANFHASRKVINEKRMNSLTDRKKVDSFCWGGPTHGV